MKKGKIGWILALLFIGYSGGILTGVAVDADQVYHTTIKKIRQNKSPDGTLVVDVDTTTGEHKSSKKLRREKRQEDRAIKKEKRKNGPG